MIATAVVCGFEARIEGAETGGWGLADEHSPPGGARASESSCMGRGSAGESEGGERGFVMERQFELFDLDNGAVGKELFGGRKRD